MDEEDKLLPHIIFVPTAIFPERGYDLDTEDFPAPKCVDYDILMSLLTGPLTPQGLIVMIAHSRQYLAVLLAGLVGPRYAPMWQSLFASACSQWSAAPHAVAGSTQACHGY
jgi:hypothetical protein